MPTSIKPSPSTSWDTLNGWEQHVADNIFNLSVEGAKYVQRSREAGNVELTRYHQRAVVGHAKYLVEGLTKVASRI